MRCNECLGAGFLILWSRVPANYPTGWHDQPYREECPTCQGSGHVEETDDE